jgi:hypothetical protein
MATTTFKGRMITVVEIHDEQFTEWERQVQEQLAGLSILETGSDEEAAADLKRQIEERGMSVDDAYVLEKVREARGKGE